MPVTWPNEGRRMQLGGMVDIRVLGPIEVFESGHEMAVGPQLRRLLGLLMVADGRNVRADAIAEDLADGDVDVDGSKIRTAVSRLRKIVGDRIETVPAGYRLRLSAMESDVDRFDALRAQFGTAPPSDRVEIGLRALALWRGPALGDLAEEPWAHAWAARLDESRDTLLEDVAEAMLELDRPHAAVELLDQHVVDNPYRERPVELLMRGQAASGQRPAALRSYQRLRIALRDDLGLDPSPELQALEGELLAAGGEGHGSAIASSGPTLTVLFTDIEGSTQMWRRDQHTMSRDLVEHDRTLEDAIGAQGGRVFKHTGDGMGAVFTTADAAVRAARRAQGALRLPVRMGIHTGEVIEREGDCYGPTVNRCARIADAGHGGQILLSAAAVAILGTADVTDLGEHALKGLAGPERIYQWGREGYAPLRVAHQASSLPTILHALIGRDDLMAAVEQELDRSRLVTLVGPGGIGKTTLALTVGERIATRVDLTLFAGLDEVNDPAGVRAAVAQALKLPSSTREAVAAALAGRRALLLIDNCEHVRDAVGDLVDDLLHDAPMCRILATSREGLGITGEQIVVVPGLDTSGIRSAAVELLTDRVRALDPSVAFDDDDLKTVREICRKVDGLPLAIELAAARVPMLGPPGVLERLDARFEVLTGSRRRRSSDRQRTLRAAVDWSHDLLDTDERAAFAHLSVFAGSFDLAAAVAMLENRPELEVLDLLTALVQKSLLTIESIDDVRRYRYLETMRTYAFERLHQNGEVAHAMQVLRVHLVDTVRRHAEEVRLGSLKTGAERLRREIPNVRASFEYELDVDDLDAAAELIAPMAELFAAIEWPIDGWAAEILAHPGARVVERHKHLLALDGIDRLRQGDRRDYRDLVAQLVDHEQPPEQVPADLQHPAFYHLLMARKEKTWRDAFLATSPSAAGTPDQRTMWRLLVAYCHKMFAGEGAEIVDDWRTAIDSAKRHDSEWVRAEAHWGAALIAQADGDHGTMLMESRALLDLRVVGSSDWMAALVLIAWAELEAGNMSAAVTLADDVFDVARRYTSPVIFQSAALHALILQSFDELEAAAILSTPFVRRIGFPLSRSLGELCEWLETELDAEKLSSLRQRARGMTIEELLLVAHDAEARHVDDEPPPR